MEHILDSTVMAENDSAARGILACLRAWCLPLTVLGNQPQYPHHRTSVP